MKSRLLTESESKATLQQSTVQNSQLFTSMTSTALSGLIVAVFLIVMLLIGLGCLFDIKTNDRFARNNLWVGK